MRLATPSLLLAAALASIYLSSYSTGLAGRGDDGTSSGLAGTACGTCHNGGDYATATALELLDGEGEAVSTYRPGETYTMRVTIATASATAPGGYGLQVLAVDADVTQAGAFGDPPVDTKVTSLRGRSYFEHRRRLAASASVQEIAWTAPAAGTGAVTVYAVGNAVNGNGGTSGDEVDEAIVTFAEEGASATTVERRWPGDVRAYAQTGGRVRVLREGPATERYTFAIYGLGGGVVASWRVLAQAPQTVTGLAPGLYVVRVVDGGGAVASRMVAVVQ